jgi:hypothetical protein
VLTLSLWVISPDSADSYPLTDSPIELYGTTDAIRSIRWLGSQDRYVVYCSTPAQLTSFQAFSSDPWLRFPVSHCTLSFQKPKTGAIPNSMSSFSEEFRPESSARPRHLRREKLQRRTDSRLRTNCERPALLFGNIHFFQWCFQSYQWYAVVVLSDVRNELRHWRNDILSYFLPFCFLSFLLPPPCLPNQTFALRFQWRTGCIDVT